MEIQTEVDSNDTTECSQNDRPSTGMFGCSVSCIFTCLCTVVYSRCFLFLRFQCFYYGGQYYQGNMVWLVLVILQFHQFLFAHESHFT